jgi:lipopolysaccharide/colanic/teichoic acid biosynthesis glycosyltransferase
MSIVGPRPEVPRYVKYYNEKQREVLSVRPGLTDYASLEYFEEGEILARSDNPEKTYLEVVLPHKLELGLKYVAEQSFGLDLKIIWRTAMRVFRF